MATDVRHFFLLIVFIILPVPLSGQTDTSRKVNERTVIPDSAREEIHVLQKVERNGLVLPEVEIKEVTIIGRRQESYNPRKIRAQERQYDRLVYNLKKTYPYAVITREKLSEVNTRLEQISDEKERKKFLKDFEKELFAEFEADVRNMTITQGRLLIKLIDRETQNTSYELIRQYRGFLSAVFWQGIARIFGSNLKAEYDPFGEDALIELIVRDIEMGWL
ncbi:MAG TPA: DUF4294 domain-containing protein [Bacteroidales bacterium]|jgi:hypothetical protein|nr:DUF4294 domain-containing protein [Bacteroidales bacterium]HOS71309.1 DUF4294 domain-containing protein [Bacteroidales bacterium]HQH24143.1 DUF4294 domain-containing protein [Bacteroidales bacterium]HQJ81768.1 DUF4294 domain-containing protein [Bacteroidales bacterium]